MSAVAEPTGAGAPSPYTVDLERLRLTIVGRARNHRNHVVAVVLVTAIVVVVALVIRSASALAALLALVPISGAFFLADARVLERWRREVFRGWTRGTIELAALRAAAVASPQLPPETLRGMLMLLPAAGELPAELRIAAASRRAAAVIVASTAARRTDALLLNVLASAIVVAALLAALWLRAWPPLLALALLVLRPAAGAWLGRRRAQRAAAELAACRREPGFSEADFERLVASVRQRP